MKYAPGRQAAPKNNLERIMESMRNRLQNKKGFTLAELLIVVAIIAILVAIMIPVFSTSRADAIQAKDTANVRAAYAEAVVEAMTKSTYDGGDLVVTLDKADIKLDSTTSIKVNGTSIEVTTTGATEPTKEITVDDSVQVKIIN